MTIAPCDQWCDFLASWAWGPGGRSKGLHGIDPFQWQFHNPILVGFMGLVYLPTFTIKNIYKINQSCRYTYTIPIDPSSDITKENPQRGRVHRNNPCHWTHPWCESIRRPPSSQQTRLAVRFHHFWRKCSKKESLSGSPWPPFFICWFMKHLVFSSSKIGPIILFNGGNDFQGKWWPDDDNLSELFVFVSQRVLQGKTFGHAKFKGLANHKPSASWQNVALF